MMKPEAKRKSFGQHFLVNEGAINTIVKTAIEYTTHFQAKTLVEIGPGQGAITLPLIQQSQSIPGLEFLCIEKDRSLKPVFPESQNQKMIYADFLQCETSNWAHTPPVVICSNLPYSVGTVILTTLCESVDKIPAMVLMFQQEVAKRIRAPLGDSDRASLSLYVQNLYEVKKLLLLDESAFRPKPKIKSEVITLIRREKPFVPSDALWQKIIRMSFLHRRKMLKNNLSADEKTRIGLERSGIDPTKRPHHLDWTDWRNLYDCASAVP